MTAQEYLNAMNKIASHLKAAVVELVAAKSYSTALMAKLKAERVAKGYTSSGPWWALTAGFEDASSKSMAIIEQKLKNISKRLHLQDGKEVEG